MNVERFKQTIDFLLQKEANENIQQLLANLVNAVNNLVSNPTHPPHQTETIAALDKLDAAVKTLFDSLTPAQLENIKEIGGYEFFSPLSISNIRQLLGQSGLTPAVLQQNVSKFNNERQAYLDVLRQATQSLNSLRVGSVALTAGETELGIRFTELIFRNEFDELVRNLNQLTQILRFYFEAIKGKPESVMVRQISSTDPIFFLGFDATVAVELALTVTWLLNTIKQIFDIKKVRNDAAKVGLPEGDLKSSTNEFKNRLISELTNAISSFWRSTKTLQRETIWNMD